MADSKKTAAQYRAEMGNIEDTMDQVGWSPAGVERFKHTLGVPQQILFNAAAKYTGSDIGKDANETAGNVVSKVTEPLGHSIPADILRTSLQTAATVGLDPVNYVAPEVRAEKILSGTIANVAERNVAKEVAQHALQSGNMSAVNQIAQQSADNLTKITPRAKPSGLDVLQGSQIPTSARGVKMISGANTFANPAIKPANMSRVSLRPAADTMQEKVTASLAKGQLPQFSKGVDPDKAAQATKILEAIQKRLK